MKKNSIIFSILLCVFFKVDCFATSIGGCGAGAGISSGGCSGGGNLSNYTTVSSSNFEKILLKFCVPREGNCSIKATYSNGKCVCSGNNIYLDRECFNPKCPAGTYISSYSNDTDTCSSGTMRVYMKN